MAGKKPHLSNPSAKRAIRGRHQAYAHEEKAERRELDRELRRLRMAQTDQGDAALGA